METSIPVSITIVGHPLLNTVTVAWSASAGMVPQALCLGAEGGKVEAQLTSDNLASVLMQCQVKVDFAIAGWEIVTVQYSQPVDAGGAQLVIDPGSWIHYLSLQLQHVDHIIAEDSTAQTHLETDNLVIQADHLVVNLTWETSQFSHPVKLSQKMRLHQVWRIPYLCILPHDRVSATISAFGMINRQLVKMKPRSLVLTATPLAPAKLLLSNHQHDVHMLLSTGQ
jgi:hypothetical protein